MRKWNHTRTKTKTESLDAMREKIFADDNNEEDVLADPKINVEKQVAAKVDRDAFWNSISEEDKNILRLRMSGMSQKEIAEKLGYKSHSTITKRIKMLKEKF